MHTGIYNMVTDGFRWRHLIFYELDHEISQKELSIAIADYSKAKSAFVAYTTSSGGVHFMGLTPVSTITWAYAFKDLDMDLKGNCSGHILRCSLKPNEKQDLLGFFNSHDFPMADQVYDMILRKFKLSDYYRKGVIIEKWKSTFCLYGADIMMQYRAKPYKRRVVA